MTEHPIIFSAPMVRALLAGTKTQTRRMVSNGNSLLDGRRAVKRFGLQHLGIESAKVDRGPSPAGNRGPYLKAPALAGETWHRVYPLVQPGDRLWVRETWRTWERPSDGLDGIRFAADDSFHPIEPTEEAANRWVAAHRRRDSWRSPIHLPRWACRLVLELAEVRVERLHAITEDDAKAEGVALSFDGGDFGRLDQITFATYRASYAWVWGQINQAHGWNACDPWVWVLTFRRV